MMVFQESTACPYTVWSIARCKSELIPTYGLPAEPG